MIKRSLISYQCFLVVAVILATLNVLPKNAFASWPVRHGDSRNSGWLPLAGSRELKPKWHSLEKVPVATFVALGKKGNLYTLTMDVKENPQNANSRKILVSQTSRLVKINPTNGTIVSVAPLGEESDSTPSLGDDGALYVPSKPLRKAVGLGLKALGLLQPDFSIPEPQAGIYAFEPASFKELAVDGLTVASHLVEQAVETLNQDKTKDTLTQLHGLSRQLQAISENITTAEEGGEIVLKTAEQVNQSIRTADYKLNQVVERLGSKNSFTEVKSLLNSSIQDIDQTLTILTRAKAPN